MKHNFLAWRNLDAGTPEEKGGGQGAIIKAIDENFKKTTEQIESVKTAQQKALDDTKKALEEEITSAKSQSQKATDAIDELRKVVASVKSTAAAQPEQKSFNQTLKEAIEEKTDDFGRMARGEQKRVSIELKAVGDISVSGNVTGSVWGANYKPGIIELPKRKVHMRQVLNGGSVGTGTDYYFMKQGTEQGAFAPTAEGASKPQVDEALVESSVKIEQISGYARVTRKAMNNIPGFISFLQSRMVERLLVAEDNQILYGTGTSPQLKGILTSGNFTASTSSATVLAEQLIDDIAALEDTYQRNANIILLRPQQYYGFFKNKASGSGEYDLPKNVMIVNGQLYINGILAVPTTALGINAGTPNTTDYVVADLSGADFLVQEGMKLEFFEQDATNVTTGKVTVRLEETVALPVYGSDYFIKGTHNAVI